MNRRDLIAAGMLALGGGWGASRARGASATPNPIKLGIATYSLRGFRRGVAIEIMRALGVKYADVKEFHLPYNDSREELAAGKREFDHAGIEVIGGGNISLKENGEAALRRYFDYARACRFPIMICAPTRDNLPLVEKLAKEYRVRMAIHNHGPEDHDFPTPRSVLDRIAHLDPCMGLCIDIGHTARAGADIVESIRLAGARLFEMHFKDLRDTSPHAEQCAVGEGVLPIPAIFRELRKVGYTGVCSLEYEIDERDPQPGMARSLAYMRGVLAGLDS